MNKLTRFIYTEDCTIGRLEINEVFECYVMEPPARKEFIADRTAIPAGTYTLEFYNSPDHGFEVILLRGTPDEYGFIEIHPGNYPKDTKGCLLPGQSYSVSDAQGAYVGPSTVEFKDIMTKLKDEIMAGTSTLEVVNTFEAVI